MTYEDWLEFALAEPRIVGVIVTGSRGRGAYVRDDSDWDLRIVVADGDEAFANGLDTAHGSDVEVSALTLSQLAASPEWDRYSYTHAVVAVDKLDGEIVCTTAARGTLAEDEARELARSAVGAYTNSLYRSLRDAQAGLAVAAQLDAAESVSALLTALFAFERRVRPFHKYLAWELATHPLPDWDGEELLSLVAGALTGGEEEQRALFRAVEPRVRERGFAPEIDDWGPHVSFLRV